MATQNIENGTLSWDGSSADVKDMSFSMEVSFGLPEIKKIIIRGNRTIVLWADGTRTISTCDLTCGDTFDPEVGFALCVIKKMYGKKKYLRMLKKAQVQYE